MFVVPQEMVRRLPVREGQIVADFGCGTGAWSLELAGVVGDKGHVYAFDVQKNLLDALEKEVKESGRGNIEVVWADLDEPEGSRLGKDAIDGVLMANALFQFEHRDEAISEAYRVIRPGGWCALIDWSDSFGGLGPAAQEVVQPDVAKRLFAKHGFVFNGDIDTGGHHYGMLFKK